VTDVVVIIAYRDMGDAARRQSYAYVCDWYRSELGCPILVDGGSDDATFTRASALNRMASMVGAESVIVQSDPDSLVPPQVLTAAIALAGQRDGLVIPHDRYLYLSQAVTAGVLVGAGPAQPTPADCEFAGPNGSGNVTVFSCQTWLTARGYDERFGLWGGDDAAFRYACDAFVAPTRRLHADMVHLWHPRLPQSNPDHPDYPAQFGLLAQYRDAAAQGPDAVRALVRTR
jgi:hypothetical protein